MPLLRQGFLERQLKLANLLLGGLQNFRKAVVAQSEKLRA